MTPTILVVGGTGNTGVGLMNALPSLLKDSKTLSELPILVVTRSANSETAKELSKIPNVQVVEQDWPMIDAKWLREHNVVRAFVASHNLPTQFAEESSLYTAMLEAGVKYVVRISTTKNNVQATTPVYYGRAHWAIENLLSQPEFEALAWTSLQPPVFIQFAFATAGAWIQHYSQTGEQSTFKTMLPKNHAVAPIHPHEVGAFAAHLLAKDNFSPHNHAKYVINGPEDITGNQLVDLVEKHAGVRPKECVFEDVSMMDGLVHMGFPESAVKSIKHAPEPTWKGEGGLAATPTSKQVLEIAPPKFTPAAVFEAMLKGN